MRATHPFGNLAGIFSILAVILLSATSPAWSESPYPVAWAQQFGSDQSDFGYSVAVDGQGNAFICGSTVGTLPGQTSAGNSDSFLAKYSPSGSLLWKRQIGTGGDEFSYGVAVDAQGNAFLSGYTSGSLYGTNAGGNDAFLAKYDGSGNQVWIRQSGSAGWDYCTSTAVDSNGNAYIGGVTLGNMQGTNAGDYDFYLSKYSPSGSLVWTRQYGTVAEDRACSIAVDNSNNVYIGGYTWGDLESPPGARSSPDAFLAKYDSAGNRSWVEQLYYGSWDYGFGVTTDAAGNAFLAGYTEGAVFGTYKRAGDLILAKYGSGGNFLWGKEFGTYEREYAMSVAVDPQGSAYVAGYTYADLGGPNAGYDDAFLTKYDGSGNFVWNQQVGTDRIDYCYGVDVDANGNPYITGFTDGSLGGPNAGGFDAFLVKFDNPNSVPEPATMALLAFGAVGLVCRRNSTE